MNKHDNQKNTASQELKKIDETKVDEIILEVEKKAREEKNQSANDTTTDKLVKRIGDKISLVLILVLLLLSIVQSVELFNLRGQILKGQFSTGVSAPASGASQGLPSQQGGC